MLYLMAGVKSEHLLSPSRWRYNVLSCNLHWRERRWPGRPRVRARSPEQRLQPAKDHYKLMTMLPAF